ncbi:hypothetical protein WBZ18_13310 [Clostridium botulinum]|uniref:Uncharacterized protein n=2 Tax=Clostridium botulinum TaxID=1491 RepID=A0A0A2HNE3_CLOBO|nr:hypothetical protein [Clostridium botulinum]AJD26419.1 hypothetical protein T257_2341 [Clostridium botulinum CDC_297]ACQ54663.1 conserved hypothetical protein [Clostridium botulinum Ba4 str. 657]AJE10100.1 hypothetical protein T259_1022 [Clostridium botulinum CDC_1436]APR00599.1 hypothetical protein RSJ2_2993 [Clostridium botulinum]APU58339.1 hypothetical protein NPD8_197 [Clostridium botulinum]
MEKVCPICNKLNTVKYCCDKCGGELIDRGIVHDYMDPYSVTLPIQDYEDYCLHIFSCNNCCNEKKEYIHKIIV